MRRIDERKWQVALLVVLAALLSACGSNSSSSGSDSTTGNMLTGIVSKGPLHSSAVHIYRILNGVAEEAPLAVVTTDNGAFSVNLGNFAGHVLVVANGGSYTDEATGIPVNLDVPLRCALEFSHGREIAVTPFTEAAVRDALTAGNLHPSTIDAAMANVKFHLNGIDPVSTLPIDATKPPAVASGKSQSYGIALGTLSQHMKDNGKSIDDVIKLVQNDAHSRTRIHHSASLKTSLATFAAGPNNKTSVKDVEQKVAASTTCPAIDTSKPPQTPSADQAKAATTLTTLLDSMGNGPAKQGDVISIKWRPYSYVYWDTGARTSNPYKNSDPNGFLDNYFDGTAGYPQYPSSYIDAGDPTPGTLSKNLRTQAYNVGNDFKSQGVTSIQGMEDTSHCSAFAAAVASQLRYSDSSGTSGSIYLLRPGVITTSITLSDGSSYPPDGSFPNIETALTDSRKEVREYGRCLVDPTMQSTGAGLDCSAFNISFSSTPVQGSVLLSNAQYAWLGKQATQSAPCWLEVIAPSGTATPDYAQRWVNAQSWANAGYFVVATIQNANGAGHIAVVRPDNSRTDIQTNGPSISQAGVFNFSSTYLTNGFSAHIAEPPSSSPDCTGADSATPYCKDLQKIKLYLYANPMS